MLKSSVCRNCKRRLTSFIVNKLEGTPLVSIRCTVYNHEPFLRQCLDGFVMQQTTFPFEAVVHDDASTDASASIIREYAKKYPDIIKPIYETENQYSKHDGSLARIMDAAMHPASKYIALCEGDDYWTDPLKLQKQVDFFESHPEFALCCSNHQCYQQGSELMGKEAVYDWVFKGELADKCFFEITHDNYFDHWWIRTLTVMYRRYPYIDEMKKKGYDVFRDDVYYYNVLTHGKGALLKDVMGVYRRHSGGLWAGNDPIDNYRIAVANAFGIYRIEGDCRAFIKTRQFTIRILKELSKRNEMKNAIKELKSYYYKVPLSEFCYLICDLGIGAARGRLSAIYHRVLKS